MKFIKRSPWLLTVIIVLVIASTLVALAGTFRSPSKDMYCLVGSSCVNGYGIQTNASNVSGSCNSTQVGYIGWNLATLTPNPLSAQLTLKTTNVTGAPGGVLTFSLLIPNNHTWTEPAGVGGTDPGYSGVIATGTATLTNGSTTQTVTFGGPADQTAANALGTYFAGLLTQNATLGVRLSGGCSTSTVVTFAERGSTNEADLIFYPETNANAVELTDFNSDNAAPTWPLYAGLGALALLAVVGVRLSQRRAAR